MRDDFKSDVKEILAKRSAYICSNPACQMLTIGPSSDPSKTTNIGVAAHITAASPGGKRYDSSITSENRSSISNGIWLCQSCAKLIDSDEIKFTIDLLKNWKILNENNTSKRLNRQVQSKLHRVLRGDEIKTIEEYGFYEEKVGVLTVRYQLQGELLHIETILPTGERSYVVVDELGNIISNQLPFPIEDYSIEIEDGLILNKVVETIDNGFLKETINLKWGNVLEIIRHSDGRLAELKTKSGGTVNHLQKKFIFTHPKHSN